MSNSTGRKYRREKLPRLAQAYHSGEDYVLAALGVHRGQPPILAILAQVQDVSQKDLAQMLELSAATVTVTLGRMQRAGLVTRRTDSVDQRVQRVSITELGRQRQQKAAEALVALQKNAFDGFSEEEKAQAEEYLSRITDNLIRVKTGKG